jgi:putative transposase
LEPGIVDQIRQATNGNFALGNSRFKEEIAAMLGRRVTPGKAVGRERKWRGRKAIDKRGLSRMALV